MIKIIPPSQFKTKAWKNGKSQTTELAINKNGTLDDFYWRLSIASVVEDGAFSDFSDYDRNLILLEGKGIKLTHDKKVDLLDKPLSFSSFDGASKTNGKLINGSIKDFNLITRQGKYDVEVKTFVDQTEIQVNNEGLTFIYSHHSETIVCSNSEISVIPRENLIILNTESDARITGKELLVINLTNIEI